MSFRRGCGPCEGRGYYGLNTKDICDLCKGYGFILFQGDVPAYATCSPCEGRGYHGLRNKDHCPVCQGIGLVSVGSAQTVLSPRGEGELVNIWDAIHPTIEAVAKSRYEANHLADAVEAAFKEINTIIKNKVRSATGTELDGADLMNRAFSIRDPVISLEDASTDTGRSIQVGYMQIYAGAMTGIRNPKAHSNIVIDKTRAIHFLFLASLLMYKLDEAAR